MHAVLMTADHLIITIAIAIAITITIAMMV